MVDADGVALAQTTAPVGDRPSDLDGRLLEEEWEV